MSMHKGLEKKLEVFRPQANLSPKNRLKQFCWVITNLLICTTYRMSLQASLFGDFQNQCIKQEKQFFGQDRKNSLLKISNVLFRFPHSNIIL